MKKLIISMLLITAVTHYADINQIKKRYENLHGLPRIEAIISISNELSEKSDEYFLLNEELLSLSESEKYSKGKGIALSNIGYYRYYQKEYEQALQNFLAAETLLSSSGSTRELIILYNRLGYYFQDIHEIDSSLKYIYKATDLSNDSRDTVGLALSYNNAGLAYWSDSIFDSALVNFETALYYRKMLNDKGQIARTLNNLGVVYYNIGHLEVALEYYYEALPLQIELKNFFGASLIQCNIAIIQRDRNELERAKAGFDQGLDLAFKSGDNDAIGYAFNGLASIFKAQNDFDKALEYYHKAHDYYKKTNNASMLMLNLISIGELYQIEMNYAQSEKYFRQAEEYLTIRHEKIREAQIKLRLGEIRKEQKRYSEAINFFNQSIEICLAISKKDYLKENYLNLSDIYEKLNDMGSALEFHKRYKEVSDQISNDETNNRIVELEHIFNTALNRKKLEEKELELSRQRLYAYILLLLLVPVLIISVSLLAINRNKKRANIILQEKNDQIETQKKRLEDQAEKLKQSNEELHELNVLKDTFFSVIAHDLRSPFNGFLGSLSLLNEGYDELTNEEKKNAISLIQTSAKSIYKLLDNLLVWSNLQRGVIKNNPRVVSLNEVLKENIDVIKDIAGRKGINVYTDCPPDILINVDKDMLGIIMRNLLSNAVKFTHKNGRVDVIAGRLPDDYLEIAVKDEGIGIPEEILDKLFDLTEKISTRGTENEPSTGLGLSLCKEFADRIGGEITVVSKEGKGSTFKIKIPAGDINNSLE